MTLKELIERAKLEAIHINPDHRVLDGEVIIELILPRCIDILVSDCVKNPEELQSLRANTTLTMVSGVSNDFPETIRPEYVETIIITTDLNASLIPRYEEYASSSNNFVGVFCYHNAQLHYMATQGTLTGYTGSLIINSVKTPVLPTLIGDTFSARDRFVHKLITFTAKVLAGQVDLPEFDYAREIKRVPAS